LTFPRRAPLTRDIRCPVSGSCHPIDNSTKEERHRRPDAYQARFERRIERRLAARLERDGSVSTYEHGVLRVVQQSLACTLPVRLGKDLTTMHEDRADRHRPCRKSPLSLRERIGHQVHVLHLADNTRPTRG
jgi:hypothetical protein